MATVMLLGAAPDAGLRLIQLADVLALQFRPATDPAMLIGRLDELPATSEKLRVAGETVTEAVEEFPAVTSRIRLLPWSAIKRFPEASTATLDGKIAATPLTFNHNGAVVAEPPSPEKP
jgi:hypothetical protein